jgi:hypothetical protein
MEKGLFRIWVVGTVIWFAAVAAVVYVYWPSPEVAPTMFDDILPSVESQRSTMIIEAAAAVLFVSGGMLLGGVAGIWIVHGFRGE